MNQPAWVVMSVEPRDDYLLVLEFADGQRRVFDAKPLLERPVFAPLKNPVLFRKVYVECGTVVWNDELDIAPEHLYEASAPIASE